MTWYGYESQIAMDQTTESIARNAAGHVYAKSDTAFTTPLAVTDLAGVVRSEIIANSLGLIEEFRVEDYKVVVWKSGDYKTQLSSIDGFVQDVETARQAAEDAYQALQDYIAANPGALPAGRQPGQILGVLPDNTLAWLDPVVSSGGGGLSTASQVSALFPSGFPAAAHSTNVGDLRKPSGATTAVLLQAVVDLLSATSPKAARDAIGATAASELAIPVAGPLATNFVPGNKVFKSDEIQLVAGITGLNAATVHAALAELAARTTSSGGGAGRIDYRDWVAGAYPVRGTVAAGTWIIWRGPVWPTIGGLYMDATLDTYLAR